MCFSAEEALDPEHFAIFCRNSAPTILWPYVRQAASLLTSDGRYGPLRLDPISIAGLLARAIAGLLERAAEQDLTPALAGKKRQGSRTSVRKQ